MYDHRTPHKHKDEPNCVSVLSVMTRHKHSTNPVWQCKGSGWCKRNMVMHSHLPQCHTFAVLLQVWSQPSLDPLDIGMGLPHSHKSSPVCVHVCVCVCVCAHACAYVVKWVHVHENREWVHLKQSLYVHTWKLKAYVCKRSSDSNPNHGWNWCTFTLR